MLKISNKKNRNSDKHTFFKQKIPLYKETHSSREYLNIKFPREG